jgi:Tfp pilus assembly major pilin PilA
VVIGILAAISLVAYNGVTGRANDTAALSNAQQAGKKVTVYALSNGEVLPADLATAGLTDGAATYQYTLNTASSPNTFCVTATSGTTSAHTAGTASSVNAAVAGPCAGHSGTSPTALTDGSSCPTGYIVVPGSSLYGTEAFCVMKYEAKDDGSGNAVSVTGPATPWVNISQTDAITEGAAACAGCHLITEAEWLTIAQNVLSVNSNWSGGTVGSGYIYSGHSDGAPFSAVTASVDDNNGYVNTGQTSGNQRRTLTLTNGEVIWDLAGNVYEWTSGTTSGGQPGSSGYAWRNWNALVNPGNLSPNPYPSYANPSAIAWTSTEGVGQAYTDSAQTNLRAFRRGGYWDPGSSAGVFTLRLENAPSSTSNAFGFRVAR